MTQAEYDALTTEQKNDGIIRFITQASTGDYVLIATSSVLPTSPVNSSGFFRNTWTYASGSNTYVHTPALGTAYIDLRLNVRHRGLFIETLTGETVDNFIQIPFPIRSPGTADTVSRTATSINQFMPIQFSTVNSMIYLGQAVDISSASAMRRNYHLTLRGNNNTLPANATVKIYVLP